MTLNVCFQFGGAFAFRELFYMESLELAPESFKGWTRMFNKNEIMIINNTVRIWKSEIFSAELTKFHGVSHKGTFTVNRSWNKWFYYTRKPIRLILFMAGFKIQLWQIVWPWAELGNCFDWFEIALIDFFSVCPYLFDCGFNLSVWYQ